MRSSRREFYIENVSSATRSQGTSARSVSASYDDSVYRVDRGQLLRLEGDDEKHTRLKPLIVSERVEKPDSGGYVRVTPVLNPKTFEEKLEENGSEKRVRVTPLLPPERLENVENGLEKRGYERRVKVTALNIPKPFESASFTEPTKPKEDNSLETEIAIVATDVNERHHIWQEIPRPKTEAATQPENKHEIRTGWSKELESISREYQRTGNLYEDAEFPADNSSLYIKQKPKYDIKWKRPWEITRDPKFFNGELNQHDVVQGSISNCWLVSAISNLCLHKELLYQVCPPNQFFDNMDYVGAFLFRFWHFGEWIEVIVDDRLPTYNRQLYFAKSKDPNEFWSALLEKAYCKIYKNYELLNLGLQSEALQDFTGGLVRTIHLSEAKTNLYNELKNVMSRNSLIGANIEISDLEDLERRTESGLVRGHAYTITGLTKVTLENTHNKPKIELIRLRNPWGDSAEWKMAWSDRSIEWNMLSSEQRREMGLVFENDGEFWMSLSDFAESFTSVDVCMLAPMSLTSSGKTEWNMSKETGSWKAGHNAGGCRNYLDTFHINPQFRIKLEEPNRENEHGKCSVVIALMRKNSNVNFQRTNPLTNTPPVGFFVYKCPEEWPDGEKLGSNFFSRNRAVGKTKSFTREREITVRFELPAGEYIIIPSTFEPHQEADFLLRIFTEKQIHESAVDHETTLLEQKQPIPVDLNTLRERLFPLFKATVGQDEWVDQIELQRILNRFVGDTNGFSLETSRSLVAMLDKNRTGALPFEDVKEICHLLQLWQNMFNKFDRNSCGKMETVELRDALRELNFSLSNNAMEALVIGYNNKSGKISFETFVNIIVALKRTFELFQEFTKRGANAKKKVVLTLDDLITATLTL